MLMPVLLNFNHQNSRSLSQTEIQVDKELFTYWQELAPLQVDALQQSAQAEYGISPEVIHACDRSDDPKAELISLLVDAREAELRRQTPRPPRAALPPLPRARRACPAVRRRGRARARRFERRARRLEVLNGRVRLHRRVDQRLRQLRERLGQLAVRARPLPVA